MLPYTDARSRCVLVYIIQNYKKANCLTLLYACATVKA